jgi:putative transposase
VRLPLSRGDHRLGVARGAVLAWRLSNTNDASFCAAALEEALLRFGTPRIFNTDSQRITASFRAA